MTRADSRPASLAKGLLAIAVVVVMWTTFLLLSRHGAKGVLTPWDIAALRFGVSGVLMAPFLWHNGLGQLSLWQALALTCSAGLGFATFAYSGFSYAPAAHGAILMPGVLPLMTTLIAAWLLREPLGGLRLGALAIIMCGVAVTASSSLGLGTTQVLIGDMLFLCAATCWAFYTVLVRRWQVEPVTAACVVAPSAMILFMPVYWLFLPSRLDQAGWSEIVIQGAFQGIGAVIVVLLAFTAAVRHLGPQVTTMLTAIVPGLGSVLAVPLLDEPLNSAVIVGLVLVTLGIIATVASVAFTRNH